MNLRGIKPLNYTSLEYMEAHLNFRLKLTNQGSLILNYLQKKLKNHIHKNKLNTFRLASIGSGTGIIDAPLVEDIQQLCPTKFLGIEPNGHENDLARKKMAHIIAENSEANFFSGTIEDFDFPPNERKYDAIIAVHVTYYSPDISPMIKKALSMLNPTHGMLLTIISANTPQNELFQETTKALHGYSPVLFDKYISLLDEMGLKFETDTIEASIDISRFAENPESIESNNFLDFFLHADSSSLSRDDRQHYIDIILQAAVRKNEKIILPHIAKAVMTSPS